MMIIKRTPEDFLVEEICAPPSSQGDFALYRLEKSGWTTADALAAVRRRWRIEPRRLSYGGLKDRHAHTIQFFTIYRGPGRNLKQSTIEVTYLGQTSAPFTSEQIQVNRFGLVLRQMSDRELEYAQGELPPLRQFGVPNYFDDQRFGSVSGGGGFVAAALLKGDHEEALRRALTAPYPHDRREQRAEKQTLRSHWGDWARCKAQLERGHARSLVDYLLQHPGDFRGAMVRLRPELRGLYLSAYQSFLWNRMLAAWLRSLLAPEVLIETPLLLGPAPLFRSLTAEQLDLLKRTRLPLHSPKAALADDDPIRPFFLRVLEEEGLTLDDFRLKGLKEMFFSRGDRAALCLPAGLSWHAEADDLYPGKHKLTLRFDLLRGSYATLVVKRLTMPRAG